MERADFLAWLGGLQSSIVGALEGVERAAASEAGGRSQPATFLRDAWSKEPGATLSGEGLSCVLEGGRTFERAAVLLLWQNFIKPFSERHGGGTPAMRLGLRDQPESVQSVLKERLFPARVGLPEEWRRYYFREVATPGIARARRHTLRLAG